MKNSLQNLIARLNRNLGQPSLEYIAIAVVLVILVVLAFNFLGDKIVNKSGTVGNEIQSPTFCADNPNAPACQP